MEVRVSHSCCNDGAIGSELLFNRALSLVVFGRLHLVAGGGGGAVQGAHHFAVAAV